MVRLVPAALVAVLLLAPVALAQVDGVSIVAPDGVPKDVLGAAKEGRGQVERAVVQLAGEAGESVEDDPLVVPEVGWAPSVNVALIGAAGAAVLGALAVAGARFVTPAEVLENPVRQRIFQHLRARTGATLKQLTDDLGLTTTNAIWHLRKLEDAGLIHSRRFNGFKVFYPAEGGVHARKLSLSMTALANGNAQEVFEYVVANPGTHQREIARALNVNHGTVRWHLKKLQAAELLSEERRGKTSAYVATEIGRAALAQLKPAAGPAIVTVPTKDAPTA